LADLRAAHWAGGVRTGRADPGGGEASRRAQRNGNVNWDDGFEILARFLRNTLVTAGLFAPPIVEQIDRDVARLLHFDVPETSDEPYDRLTDRVVEWGRAHPDPVPLQHNRDLRR
jgi:hypothetical protein